MTEVVSAGHFWAQEVSEKSTIISQQMSDQIMSLPSLEPISKPSVDQHCLALFPEDGMYYRGRVLKVYTHSFSILYIDFGNVKELGLNEVFEIPLSLLTPPQLSAEFFLAKVKPSFRESSDGYWSDKANRFFSETFSQKVSLLRVFRQLSQLFTHFNIATLNDILQPEQVSLNPI